MRRVPLTSPSSPSAESHHDLHPTATEVSTNTQVVMPTASSPSSFWQSPATRLTIGIFLMPLLMGGIVKGVEVVRGSDATQEIIAKWSELKEQRTVELALIKQEQLNQKTTTEIQNREVNRRLDGQDKKLDEIQGDIKIILTRGGNK